MNITLPYRLDFQAALLFGGKLLELEGADDYSFDFRYVEWVEPFAIVYLSSQITAFKALHPYATFKAVNYGHLDYAAHMGFFHAFGLRYGNKPGEATGSSTYVPMTLYRTSAVKMNAAKNDRALGAYATQQAQRLVGVLTQGKEPILEHTLTYSVREIIRNVLEHSLSSQYAICAQYWRTKQEVEVVILDRGVGIKETLNRNPHIWAETELEAILEAAKAGVSGKVYAGVKTNPDDEWVNSGYGLYMVINLLRSEGSVFISSNDDGVSFEGDTQTHVELSHHGTIVRIRIAVKSLQQLRERLQELRDEATRNNAAQSASKSSLFEL